MAKETFLKAKAKIGQVWVETAIYTLIGLVIIGIIIAIVTPAIDRYKDELIIEQTLTVLNNLDEKIKETRDAGAGNRRIISELRIKKGSFSIDSLENNITYVLEESRLKYSEPGEEIEQGEIKIKTGENGRRYDITMTLTYDDINLIYSSGEVKKTLYPATIPYKLFVENNGSSAGQIQIIIGEIS